MIRREGYKFRQDICIPCYGTDSAFMLKPAAFMDFAQEIAYWAASELGFGYDQLHIHHTAWVLSRMHIHFEDYPCWRENVSLFTWHKGAESLFYLRDFELVNVQGESCIQATSSWVVIDERTRRLVRPEDLAQFLKVDYQVDDAIVEPAPKIGLPKGQEPEYVKDHVVAYSDIDLIGHTNNARYAVWAMDCLPFDQARQSVKDLYINFNKETKAGEKVQLFRAKDADSWYVEGRVDGKSCFVVKIDI